MIVNGKRVRWAYKGLESTCIIEDATQKGLAESQELRTVLAKSTIKRYVKDPENRALARFKTLSLAVRQLPKEERADIWENYRKSRKVPLWGN